MTVVYMSLMASHVIRSFTVEESLAQLSMLATISSTTRALTVQCPTIAFARRKVGHNMTGRILRHPSY